VCVLFCLSSPLGFLWVVLLFSVLRGLLVCSFFSFCTPEMTWKVSAFMLFVVVAVCLLFCLRASSLSSSSPSLPGHLSIALNPRAFVLLSYLSCGVSRIHRLFSISKFVNLSFSYGLLVCFLVYVLFLFPGGHPFFCLCLLLVLSGCLCLVLSTGLSPIYESSYATANFPNY
jgi:hypothetical protein